jgi:predicted site-specific integrase-resolvase
MMDTSKSSTRKSRKMKLKDAAAFLGVSIPVITRLVSSGTLKYVIDPLDRRKKMVSVEELERLKRESLAGD